MNQTCLDKTYMKVKKQKDRPQSKGNFKLNSILNVLSRSHSSTRRKLNLSYNLLLTQCFITVKKRQTSNIKELVTTTKVNL